MINLEKVTELFGVAETRTLLPRKSGCSQCSHCSLNACLHAEADAAAEANTTPHEPRGVLQSSAARAAPRLGLP